MQITTQIESSICKLVEHILIYIYYIDTMHYTLKDFKNAKNENYYFLHPEHF